MRPGGLDRRNENLSNPDEAKAMQKQTGRARVFAFFWVFALAALSSTVMDEHDILLHVVDDYVDITLAVVAIIVLAVLWRRNSLPSLKNANNIQTVLAVLLMLVTFFAISQEIGDPADFGNEIPTLFFAIFMLINRFV